MSILLTGGLGYIGSHTAVELLQKGHDIIVVDDLSNSKIDVKDKIQQITGKKFKFIKADLKNYKATYNIFKKNKIDDIIHFAGYKAVGESVEKPVMYYENNLLSTINLLKCMQKFDVNNFVFSSSATVYGLSEQMPLKEDFPTSSTNPYGRTKLFIEEILKDFIKSNPNGIPNNLMPYITKVATGKLNELSIFGNDYPTTDGTGVRDYIHVCDLALGHVLALEKLSQKPGVFVCNLGTGHGYSVLEIVNTFNKVNGNLVKYKFASRRAGDIAVCYADTTKAQNELGFNATKTLEDMCKSSYLIEKNNK